MKELEFKQMIIELAETQVLASGYDSELKEVAKNRILRELTELGSLKLPIKIKLLDFLEERCSSAKLAQKLIEMVDFKKNTPVDLAKLVDKLNEDKTFCSNPDTVREDWEDFAEPCLFEQHKNNAIIRKLKREISRQDTVQSALEAGMFSGKSGSGSSTISNLQNTKA